MQRYTIFFIALNAVHVSGGFSAHHLELKLYTQHLVYVKLACCYRQRGWVGSANLCLLMMILTKEEKEEESKEVHNTDL